jgi:hypothetical protein
MEKVRVVQSSNSYCDPKGTFEIVENLVAQQLPFIDFFVFGRKFFLDQTDLFFFADANVRIKGARSHVALIIFVLDLIFINLHIILIKCLLS